MAQLRIAIDAFGGDNAPQAVVEGCVQALAKHNDWVAILSGDEARIRTELAKYSYDDKRVEVIHAPEVITCEEQPTVAIKRKKESSLVRALQAVKDGQADCVLSAGSTGALLAGATLIIRRLPGVKRPALAVLLPTVKGSRILMLDSGANTDCKPSYLQQFAVMADAYMRKVEHVDKPRVGLLNNGAEAEKGNMLTKAVYPLLQAAPIDFAGNCEARDILSGDYDVLVCDGFDGNVVLKYTEGMASALMGMLKAELMADTRSKLGAALSKPAFKRFKRHLDYTEYGGAPLLGIAGGVIKAHGSSNAKAFCSAIEQARAFAAADVNASIAAALASLPDIED
ncbi:MAG: phosphate acyltransferase PlsX [Clostridia bacterium]|nr:phosphate acyltransferase PlsX [Clostridia bacterium]